MSSPQGSNITETGKICRECKLDLDLKEFGDKGKRNTCKKCKKEQVEKSQKEKKRQKDEGLIGLPNITHKICSTCNTKLPIERFRTATLTTYRNKCNKCEIETYKKTPHEIIIEESRGKSQICIRCNIEKDIITCFQINGNTFRHVCMECYNKCNYSAKSRARQRLEDEEGFKARNTLSHKLWYEKNKEHVKSYMDIYSQTLTRIVGTYLSSSKAKKLPQGSDTSVKELIASLITQPCFYCGYFNKDEEKYIGVDRINSEIGYTKENCVSCCTICNYMKNSMDVASFLRKVREIAIFNNGVLNLDRLFLEPLNYHVGVDLVGGSCNYSDYKYSAKKRNKPFNLSLPDFKAITLSKCYLCGLSSDSGIGIDRKNNDEGYNVPNSFPCCSYCNFMKKTTDYDMFLTFIKNITTFSTSEKHDDLCEKSTLQLSASKSKVELGKIDF